MGWFMQKHCIPPTSRQRGCSIAVGHLPHVDTGIHEHDHAHYINSEHRTEHVSGLD